MSHLCPVCSCTQAKSLFSVGTGALRRCQDCRLGFYTPQPTADELEQFYNHLTYRENYAHSTMAGQDFAQERYQRLHRDLQQRSPTIFASDRRLLDIGCGIGDLLKAAERDGWQVAGTEISAIAAQQAGTSWQSRIHVGSIMTLELPQDHYNLITLYHVIEHVLDPVQTLSRLRTLLTPHGVLFLETPNFGGLGARLKGAQWSHIIPPEHLTYFEATSLKTALKQAGFQRFQVFTASPQVIGSVAALPAPLKAIATLTYRLAPKLGLGAALQAIAFKDA